MISSRELPFSSKLVAGNLLRKFRKLFSGLDHSWLNPYLFLIIKNKSIYSWVETIEPLIYFALNVCGSAFVYQNEPSENPDTLGF